MLRHVRREPSVRPVVERPLEHDEREHDAAVEARLAPDARLPPPSEGVQRRRRPAHDERQRVHLDQVEDDPGEDAEPGEERPVERARLEPGRTSESGSRDVVRRRGPGRRTPRPGAGVPAGDLR